MFLEYTLNALELHCDLQVLICLNQSGPLPLLPPLMFLAIAPLQCTGFGQGVVIANRPAGTPQSTPPLPLFAHCLISGSTFALFSGCKSSSSEPAAGGDIGGRG